MNAEDTFTQALRSALAPDPHRDPVDFLEHNVRSIPYSPLSGPFRISNAPWLAEPLRCLTDPEVQEMGVMGNVQSGKSWIIEGASCILPVLAPGPTLILQDIDRNAQDFLETRLRLLFESVEPVKALLGPDGVPKNGVIQFRGNSCWVLGANNEKNLQRRSIRYVLGDELWLWPVGALKQALARITAYKWQSKVVLVSQGATEGHDWAEWFASTDRRVWSFECPSCGVVQPYQWEQVIFPKDAKTASGWNLDGVRKGTRYQCKSCSAFLPDTNRVRTDLNKSGRYVVTNPDAPKSRRGYHYNALAMQWGLTWGDLAVECIEARSALDDRGENQLRVEFIQKRLAQIYREEPDEINVEGKVGGFALGDDWPEEGGFVKGKPTPGRQLTAELRAAPDFVRMRFMTVDVQRRGFYYVVRSWSGDGLSRLYACGFCFTWAEVIELQQKNGVHAANVFVDSGDQTDEVLSMCGKNGWVATRGDARNEFAWKVKTPAGVKTEIRPYSPPVIEASGTKRVKRFYFSNLRLKDTLALLIRRGKHARADDVPEEYLAQMQAERRTIGQGGKPLWEQIGSRANHFWDCEVMGLIPALGWKLTGKGAVAEEPEAPTPTEPSSDDETAAR